MNRAIILFMLTLLIATIPPSKPHLNMGSMTTIEKVDPDVFKVLSKESTTKVIITFYKNVSKRHILKKIGISRGIDLDIINGYASIITKRELERLLEEPGVKHIYLSRRVWIPESPQLNKTQMIKLHPHQYTQYEKVDNNWRKRLGIDYLESIGINGGDIVVAVIDSGIDKTHPDLQDAVVYEESFIDYDFDGEPDEDPMDLNGHGTHVAGIIAGRGVASGGAIKGAAPGAQLWNLRTFTEYGFGYDAWIIKAIERAAESPDVDIISMSLGGIGCIDSPVYEAAQNAWNDYGKIVVCAAGNEYTMFSIGVPGSVHEIITVGAVDKDDTIAEFSSRGPNHDLSPKPDIVAPGVAIPSTYLNGTYAILSGTSMATPVVSGVVALLLQADPSLTNDLMKYVIMSTAIDLGLSPYVQGAGLINPVGAYELITGSDLGDIYREYYTLWDPTLSISHGYMCRAGFYYNQSNDFIYFDAFISVEINGHRHVFYLTELRPISGYTHYSAIDQTMYGIYSLEDPLGGVQIDVFYYADFARGALLRYNITPINADSYSLFIRFDIDVNNSVSDNISYDGDSIAVYDYIAGGRYYVITMNPSPNKVSLTSFPLFDIYALISTSQIYYDALPTINKEVGDVGGILVFSNSDSNTISISIGQGPTQDDAKDTAESMPNVEIPSFTAYEILLIRTPIPTDSSTYTVDVQVRNFGTTSVSDLTLVCYEYPSGLMIDNITGISLHPKETKTYQFTINHGEIIRIALLANDTIYQDNAFIVSLKTHVFHGAVFHPFELAPPLEVIYGGQTSFMLIQAIMNESILSPIITLSGNASPYVAIEDVNQLNYRQILFNISFSIPKTISPGLYILNISISSGTETEAFYIYNISIVGPLGFDADITQITISEDSLYSDRDYNIERGELVDMDISISVINHTLLEGLYVLVSPVDPYLTPGYYEYTNTSENISVSTTTLIASSAPTYVNTITYLFGKTSNATILMDTFWKQINIDPRDDAGAASFQISYSLYSYTLDKYLYPGDSIYSNDILVMDLYFENTGTSSATDIMFELMIEDISLSIGMLPGVDPGDEVGTEIMMIMPLFVGSGNSRFYFRITYVDLGNMSECSSLFRSEQYYIVGAKIGEPYINASLYSIEEASTARYCDLDGTFEKGELGIFSFQIELDTITFFPRITAIAKGEKSMSLNSLVTQYLPPDTSLAVFNLFGPDDTDTINIYLEISYTYVESINGVLILCTSTQIFKMEYTYMGAVTKTALILGTVILLLVIFLIVAIYYRKRKKY